VEFLIKNLAKKIMIYSMAGMMQVGLAVTVVAASPLYNDGPQRIVQLDDGQPQPDQRQHRPLPCQVNSRQDQ
jgi:hypothetical protein